MILPMLIEDSKISFPYLSDTKYDTTEGNLTKDSVSALVVELEKFVNDKKPIPLSDEFNLGGVVYVPFSIWVKIQYHNARIETKTTNIKLAERIGCKQSQMSRINSFTRQKTDVDSLLACLEFMGIVMTVDFKNLKF